MGLIMDEIEFVKNLNVIELKKNDILVVSADMLLSPETAYRIKEMVENNLPKDLKGDVAVFVLEGGMQMGVIRDARSSNDAVEQTIRQAMDNQPRRRVN